MRLSIVGPLTLLLAAGALGACERGGTGPRYGDPARLEVIGGNGQVGTAGQPLPEPVQVRVEDARGRAVPGQAVNFAVTGGGGSVAVPTATTDAEGRASTTWTLGTQAAAAQTLEARVGTASGQVLTSEPITATVQAAAPARVVAVGDTLNNSGAVNEPARDSLAVRVLDAHGNPVSGATVNWAATEGGGSVSPATTTTDVQGVARTRWTLGPRTDVVQGVVASVAGAGAVNFFGRAATGVEVLSRVSDEPGAGSTITVVVSVGGPTGPIPGARGEWTVLSGGGTVNPATSVTGTAPSYGTAQTQWTLGPAGGTQTLRANVGSLQAVLTVTALASGQRVAVTQVPGQVLDATNDRVLWLDTSGGTRLVKIRSIDAGTDIVVKADTVRTSFTHTVEGHLFPGGTLVWSTASELFEYRGGTLAALGPYGEGLSTEGTWVAWSDGTTVYRRDLAGGTTVTVGAGTRPDVGADGDVVFMNGGAWLYTGGVAAPLATDHAPSRLRMDGTNIVYTTVSNFLSTTTLYLYQAGGADALLISNSSKSGGTVYVQQAGGWTAYANPASAVFRRSPAGATEDVTPVDTGNRPEALAPDGTLVYFNFSAQSGGRYYMVLPDGSLRALGTANPDHRVVWRDGSFLVLAGGSVDRLTP